MRLAHDVDNIVGLKDAAANPAETARVVGRGARRLRGVGRRRHDDAADDGRRRRRRHLGGGALGRARDGRDGRPPSSAATSVKARELNALLIESYDFETGDLTPNPIPAKAMMRALGQPAGQCRLPLGPAPEGLEARALEVHGRLRNS